MSGISIFGKGMKLEKFGTVPEGVYTLTLDDIILKEKVFAINSKNIPETLMKVIRNKEMKELTEEQVKQLDSIDVGEDGFFPNTKDAKPRWQNRLIFVFHDEQGNKHTTEFYGGPKLNKAIMEFLERATGKKIDTVINQDWEALINKGDQFRAKIDVVNNFNRIDVKSVRKVGLEPLADSATTNGDFSPTAKALLKYLQGEGKGMNTGDIAQLFAKNITVDGVTLNDNGAIMLAFGEIKAKSSQYQVDGKINIVLK